MKSLLILILCICGVVSSNFLLDDSDQDELLMVFQVTRHGARTGLHQDFFNMSWVSGELTGSGMRQHYLIGQQLRAKYIDQQQFLSPSFKRHEMYVRSTDYNRTIQSAQSQLMGLYPPSSNTQQLRENQTDKALPPFNISDQIIEKAHSNLGNFALPNNFQPIPVHSFDGDYDFFQPSVQCPIIEQVRAKREVSPKHKQYMNEKYNQTIGELATAMNFDPATFNSIDAIQYTDALWSRSFDQYPMPGFDQQLLDDMMLLYLEYYNWTLAMNETTRKAFLTGILTEIVDVYKETIEKDKAGKLYNEDRLKFYFYSDHDDSIITLCDGFRHALPNYPPYATQIIFELHRLDQKYYVNMTANGQSVPLQGACGHQDKCEFDTFQSLIREISFYGDKVTYDEECGVKIAPAVEVEPQPKPYTQSFSTLPITGKQPEQQSFFKRNYQQVLAAYIVIMSFVVIIWFVLAHKGHSKPVEYNEVD